MSCPPAKRQRTENASITRSDIWHNDGSLVLQADNTQFRVHWGVLALHSSFFRAMQSVPQPPDQPSVDGCPVLEMQDAVQDIEHLLKVLYNPTFLLQTALPLPIIAALIRLGRKYEFQDLLDAAVERLTFENPATLEEYDARRPDPASTYSPTRIVHYPGLLFDMLTLARENDILTALPCAYYRALHRYNQVFDGIKKGDGTWASLALADQRQCVLSRERLMRVQFQQGYSFGWLRSWEYGGDCTDPVACGRWRDRRLRSYLDVFTLVALSVQKVHWETGLCASCAQHTLESVTAGRKKIWEELPGFFDLLPWAELKNNP
ncbi:hypothetical protein DFH09DRAFT_908850 [Mycena vulgaris]|nr:hypothetical protein DFH09DRAFT_908850 [Mycena vulgaris]